jgi:hypothetical protein
LFGHRGRTVTEPEWLTCSNSHDMLSYLMWKQHAHRKKSGRRKMRLFGCASCRLIGSAEADPRSLAAVEFAERLADGKESVAGAAGVQEAAHQALVELYRATRPPGTAVERSQRAWAMQAARALVDDKRTEACAYAALRTSGVLGIRVPEREADLRAMAPLLRDIFGNLFRPVTFSLQWRTDTVLTLARQMYESRDFSALPILADALQDAGCDSDAILSHCRGPGPHVRGCWVVDLVLGKE